MKKALKIFRNYRAFRALPNRAIRHSYDAEGEDLEGMREVQTSTYLYRGLVDKEQLDEKGLIPLDKYYDISKFIGSFSGHKALVTSRIIVPDKDIKELQFDIESLGEDGRGLVNSLNPTDIGEVASLAKARGVPTAIVLQHICANYVKSRQIGLKYWVFGLHNEISPGYESLFSESMQRLGDRVQLGSIGDFFTPYLVELEGLHNDLARLASSRIPTTRKMIASKCIDTIKVLEDDT